MTIKMDNLQVTEVTDNFRTQIRQILEKRLKSTWNAKQEKIIQYRLTRSGEDRMITALKRLKFKKFNCLHAPGDQIYLCGETDDLILEIRGEQYNIGPYYVAISEQSILTEQNQPLHLFPKYDPHTPHRHLHHYAIPGFDNPLSADTRTCWASIGPSYLSAVHDADIADMFRVMYIFLIRLDWNSPYDTTWAWEAMEHGVRS